MNIKNRINTEYILLHATFQLVAGIVYGFGVYILTSKGYSSGEAGTCLSCSSLLYLLTGTYISNYLDNSKKISSFDVAAIVIFLVGSLYIVNYFIPSKSLILTITCIACTGLYSLLEPLINSMNTNFADNGIKLQFSTARAIGSFSYGTVCAVFGVLTKTFSYNFVILGGVGFSLAMFITVMVLRKDFYSIRKDISTNSKVDDVSLKDFIKNNKIFILMCLSLMFIFTGYLCTDNFMLLVCENVGGSSSDMGVILCFKAMIECVTMLLFPKISSKLKLNTIILIAGFAFAVKGLAIYLAPTILFVYIAQLFQSISFGFIFPGIIEYIYQHMTVKEAVRGNALFSMTISIGSLVSGTIGGYIADLVSISAMEFAAFLSALIGAIGLAIVLIKSNKYASK